MSDMKFWNTISDLGLDNFNKLEEWLMRVKVKWKLYYK